MLSRVVAKGNNSYIGQGGLFVETSDLSNRIKNSSSILVGLGDTKILPGPNEGYIRFYLEILGINNSATPNATITLEPIGYFLGRAISLGGVPPQITSTFGFGTNIVNLKYGESIHITNGGSGTFQLFYSYIDIPDTDITIVRTQVSNTPIEVIPVPTTGFYNRLINFFLPRAGAIPAGLVSQFCFNDDTAAVVMVSYLGTDIIARSTSFAANGQCGPTAFSGSVIITSLPYKLSTFAVVATRPVNVMLAYITLPLP